jgi:hypothetical protein
MKIVFPNRSESEGWFEDMVESINNTQQSFISNIKTKVDEEQQLNSHDSVFQDQLQNNELNELLNSVDHNTKEFITKLTQGMEEIIKSHKPK